MMDTAKDKFELINCFTPPRFEHPSQVVNDPDLTLNEKRAILASCRHVCC